MKKRKKEISMKERGREREGEQREGIFPRTERILELL